MSADCHIIHSDDELSSVSKDEVLIQSLAAYMKISFLHDFLFAKVWIQNDSIVVLLRTTEFIFFFYAFLKQEANDYARLLSYTQHRSRNKWSRTATTQALRAARSKGRPRSLLLPEFHLNRLHGSFRDISHLNVQQT